MVFGVPILPRHSKIYQDLIPIMERVITNYMGDVRSRSYPGPERTVYMGADELESFAKDFGWDNGRALAETRKCAS